MKTDITINATSATDNKKVTNKISYVNPNLTNGQAINLAQAFNQLTTNSYVKTTRTDTTDCDNMPQRPITSMRYRKTTGWQDVPQDGIINMTTAEIINKSLYFSIKTDLDGEAMQILNLTDTTTAKPCGVNQIEISGPVGDPALQDRWQVIINNGAYTSDQTDIPPCTITFTAKFNQTNAYDAWEKQITFNITQA